MSDRLKKVVEQNIWVAKGEQVKKYMGSNDARNYDLEIR